MIGEVYKHKKRGTEYRIVAMQVQIQCSSRPLVEKSFAGDTFVVYQSLGDGSVWVRPTSEFTDGRFARVEKRAPV